MPIIQIERKTRLDKDISEFVLKTYEIPEKIIYNDKVLSFNSYFQAYMDDDKIFISAKDYINSKLAEIKNHKENKKINTL